MATQPTKPYMFLILDGSDDAQKTQDVLRVLSTDTHVSGKKSDLDTFIDTLNGENKTIVLIVSGTIGVQLKTDLLDGTKYKKIDSIYIYCHNAGAHRRWSSEIDKIKDVCTSYDELLAALGWVKPVSEQPTHVVSVETSSTTATTTTSSTMIPSGEAPDAATTEGRQWQTKFSLDFELNAKYHSFLTLMKHYVHIPPYSKEQESFATMMTSWFPSEQAVKVVMDEFRQSYSNDQPMKWIQRHQCFSSILFQTFAGGDPSAFVLCGFLFRDLLRQFQRFPTAMNQEWYCYQMCSKEQVKEIREGRYTTLLSFASATSDRALAETALSNTSTGTSGDTPVLFAIKTDAHRADALPFAKLNELLPNCNQKTDEVVFMMGSFFHIDRIETVNNLVTVHITLCAYEDDGPNRRLFEQYQQMYVVNNSCNLLLFSCLLFQLGVKLDREDYKSCAETSIPIYSASASEENTEVSDAQVLLSSYKKEWDATITTCEKSIDLRQKQNRPLDRALVDVYQQLARACQEKGRDADSLKHAREGVSVLRKVSTDDDDCQILPFCHMMVLAYEKGDKLDKAVASCYRALSIAIQDDVYFKKELCWIYDALAKLEEKNKQYQLAAGFSEKLLALRMKTDQEQSSIVGDTCINLGKLYRKLENFERARGYFQKALNIYEAIEPPGSIKQMEIEDEIAGLTN